MRARNIKPGYFKNEDVADCSFEARLLFIGLWMIADREGRLEDRPRKIKAHIFPYDKIDTEPLLTELVNKGLVIRYEVDGVNCLCIPNFIKHQKPHHMECPSDLPPMPGTQDYYQHTRIGREQRDRIMQRDESKCKLCGSTRNLHIDHIEPRALGGNSTDSNLRVLCSKCNAVKGARDDSFVMSKRPQVVQYAKSKQDQVNETASCALNPDSLNPESLNPSSLNPESQEGEKEKPKEDPRPPRLTCPDLADFDRFWAVYPHKPNQYGARVAWNMAAMQDDFDGPKIIEALKNQVSAGMLKVATGSNPLHAKTWIQDRRWMDPIDPSATPKPPPDPKLAEAKLLEERAAHEARIAALRNEPPVRLSQKPRGPDP